MQQLLSKLQTPSFKAVIGIIQYAGDGMTVTRHDSVLFPTCTVQVWELTPQTPPLDRASVRVAVALRDGKMQDWTPLDQPFEEAVAHYRALAAQTVATVSPPQHTMSSGVGAVAATIITLPLTPGVRFTAPLSLSGKPVVFQTVTACTP